MEREGGRGREEGEGGREGGKEGGGGKEGEGRREGGGSEEGEGGREEEGRERYQRFCDFQVTLFAADNTGSPFSALQSMYIYTVITVV